MKRIYLFLFSFLFSFQSNAQIASGSIAPNFTSTDIDGTEWTLYDVLDQGKIVILDISATWCAPCWDYHNDGHLEMLYTLYGPDGLDEYMVFLVEGDESTTLADLQGTGNSTLGDWTAGTHYPILDDRDIAEAYQINFFPTLFMVCPDRRVYQMGQISTNQIYDMGATCPLANGSNNASLLSYEGFEGNICENVHFPPSILMQNMGEEPLTSATITLELDGNMQQEIQWTGNLATYNVATIAFDSIVISDDKTLEISILNTNGAADEDPSNNNFLTDILVAPFAADELVTLQIQLDNSPFDTYWEIADADENVLYYHGNRSVLFPTASNEERYQNNNELVGYELYLPKDGCYEFRIYDDFGDGLTGSGFYKITSPDGSVLVEGGDFNFEKTEPFGISGSDGTSNNGTLLSMLDLPDAFCFEHTFSPTVFFQNVGNNPISTIEFEVTGNSGTYLSHTWTGNIEPTETLWIDLPPITVTKTDDITVETILINGEPYYFNFRKEITRSLFRQATTASNWTVDFFTGSNAHELYWQITDENGTILIDGGNTVVATTSGGMGIATTSDDGAYDNSTQILEEKGMPSVGCYHLRIIDDGGDGLTGGGFGSPTPFFRIRNDNVGIIINVQGNFGELYETNIEISSPNALADDESNFDFTVAPNPTNSELGVFIKNEIYAATELTVRHAATGSVFFTKQLEGNNSEQVFKIPVDGLPAGVYLVLVKMENGETMSKRVVVLK